MIPQTKRLDASTLALFGDGLSWREILKLTHDRGQSWWRAVVIREEDAGLLWWGNVHRKWYLTDAGHELVRASCRGAA